MTRPARVTWFIMSMTVGAVAATFRRRQLRSGATAAESTGPMPGDDLVADPDLTATRAITIHAGVDDGWPWIVQLGQGRGGFYSYDSLENLIGCDYTARNRSTPTGSGSTSATPCGSQSLTVVSFLMSERMLRSLRDRAEKSGRRSEPMP